MGHRHLQGLARHGNTRDTNEKPISDGLRAIGAKVFQLDRPCDLLVGYRRRNFLFEVKLPLGPAGGSSHSELNDTEKEFHEGWRGQIDVIRSLEDAIAIMTSQYQ
jgi:hypothetical protein